jgi:hypothetical protein
MTAPVGGHTVLARRWIARNPGRRVHDVVLTGRAVDAADPALASAALASGGTVRSVADVASLRGRARALRALAARADVVVLHVHMWDVLSSLAFAYAGGPPVLLMNHADHAFWVGAALTARLRPRRHDADGGGDVDVPLDVAHTRDDEAPRATAALLGVDRERRADAVEQHAVLECPRAPTLEVSKAFTSLIGASMQGTDGKRVSRAAWFLLRPRATVASSAHREARTVPATSRRVGTRPR